MSTISTIVIRRGVAGEAGPAGATGATGVTGATGPAGPAPSGTGFVKVTGGVLDTPSATTAISTVTGLQTALDGKESSEVQFFEDFSRYSDGSTITNGVTLPILGNPWRIVAGGAGGGAVPIITGGGFGDVNSRLWYIGSVIDTPTDRFSFGCETIALPTGAGSVTPYAMNMSFSRREMLTSTILPAGVMHINLSMTGVADINYFPDPFTSVGATDICTATNGEHGMITGDPVYLSGVNLPSGVSNAQTAYAIVLSTTTFKLATTYNNAIAGTAIELGTNGGVACYFQIFDITCINRTVGGSGYTFRRNTESGDNFNGLKFAYVIELDGEYITITRSGVGSVVFRIPSLARRTGSQMHFWYESSGLTTAATETAYGKITKAWAGAPKINRQFTADPPPDKQEIRGGSATTSSLNIRATSNASAVSGSDLNLYGGNSARALSVSYNGYLCLGDTTPISTIAAWPKVQLVGGSTQGSVMVTSSNTQSSNKDSSINFGHYTGQTSGLVAGIRVQSTAATTTTSYGGSNVSIPATMQHSFYTGANIATYSGGTERLRIDSAGAVTIFGDTLILATAKTPVNATATGARGQIATDADYIYVCTATNIWKRVAISTW